ncbi:hypothetical protein B6I21_04200 [candidate division KSB1 bacterium 4572_119]|nr:MAG: hypothetical protein B6I21_04200 [candidate division KSB1 bacterium 4572_119]
MGNIPKQPEEIFEKFTNDYKAAFGTDLVAIILYGSAARGQYVFKKSDINFLIVLSEKGIFNLQKALPLIKSWQGQNVSTPLMLTKNHIQTSLDTFPIEFWDMRENHKVIFGEDVFSGIEISPEYLRLQAERELRGKLIQLRENYLNTAGDPKKVKHLLNISLSSFATIFSALLKLKEIKSPASRTDIFKNTAKEFNLDYSIFEKVIKIKENDLKMNKSELLQLIEKYIEEISKLIKIVDEL